MPKEVTLWASWYDAEDPVLSVALKGPDKYAPFVKKWQYIQKLQGTDQVNWWTEQEDFDATQEIDPNTQYKSWQLEQLANELLRQDSKREMCRKCGGYGSETGVVESQPQADEDGNPTVDGEGNTLYMDFPELACEEGHRWYKGEGKDRTIAGENPILFENHLQDRRRREIYTSIGTPDPSIQQGMYNRTHPQGRKVNSTEQRKRNGASFFR
jgi:hypothetical protein